MRNKLLKNALIGESFQKFTRQEKHEIVTELLKEEGLTQRGLAKQIGIPYSTVHDWASLRQDNKGENVHVSFTGVITKLNTINVETFTDWGRIEQIKTLCEDLLSKRKDGGNKL